MNKARGFSMVELMVAITLALIVTTGVISVFVGSRTAYQSTAGVGAVADGGRFALDFLQQGIRNAGYLACGTSQKALSILNPGATPLPFTFTQALGGFEANATGGAGAYAVATPPVAPDAAAGDWVGGLDGALSAPPLVVKNSDVLVVRETLRNNQASYVTAIVDGDNKFSVNLQGNLAANQIAVISDCAKAAVIQITSAPAGGPGNVVITHNAAGIPGNNAAALPVSFGIGSQVTPVDTIVYYIGTGADGDGALFGYDLNAGNAFTATELVPDIEAMQVLYGVDTNGTQTVAEYLTADQVVDFNTVISVKIAVLAASQPGSMSIPAAAPTYTLLGNTVTAPRDTRARQVFEITVGVRNSAS
jgi:type IV pilus assembly protein PilW